MQTRSPSSLPLFGAALLGLCLLCCPAQAGPGLALSFDGINDYVLIPHRTGLNPYPLTLMAWVRTSQNDSTFRGIAAKTSQVLPTNGYSLTLRSGHLRATYVRGPAGFVLNGTNALDGGVIADGRWHHVAFVVDADSGRLYVDGGLRVRQAWTGTPGACTTSQALYFGEYLGDNIDAEIDEVSLWNVAHTPEQIQREMYQALTGTETGLVGCWGFNEVSGIAVFDGSGHNHRGTLYNKPTRVVSSVPFPLGISLNGGNPIVNECRAAPFLDPGAKVVAPPGLLAGGGYQTMGLRADGKAVTWDYNTRDLAPLSASNLVFVACGGSCYLGLKPDGTVLGWGFNNLGQATGVTNGVYPYYSTGLVTIAGQILSNVVQISAGEWHSMALRADGTVVAWGTGSANDGGVYSSGQAMVPAGLNNVVSISAGRSHSLALKSDGTIVGWGGTNWREETNAPAMASNAVAIAAGAGISFALKTDGTVVQWGYAVSNLVTLGGQALSNVVQIVAATGGHNMALRDDATVVVWGSNSDGQTNVPPGATNLVQIAAGETHCLALRADGAILAWGDNWQGELNICETLTNLNLPITVTSTVNTNLPGSYQLVYSATNAQGATGLGTRSVIVSDTRKPALALLGANPLVMQVGTLFTEPGASAMDVCAGDISGSILRTGSVNANQLGNYALTYSIQDPSGNSTSVVRTVIVGAPPSIGGSTSALAATNAVTGTRSLRLDATVNPNGLATTAFFQYGLKAGNYPGSTPVSNFAAGYAASPLAGMVDGMIPGVTYHYRVVASNSLGLTCSTDQIFIVSLLFLPGDLNGDGAVDQGELDLVASNHWQHSPWLCMTNTTGMGSTNVSFSLTNSLDGALSVQFSTNLSDWLYLGPALPRYHFVDPAATNPPQRYYRLHYP